MTKPNLKIGDRINDWTILDFDEKKTLKTKRKHFLCKCKCGKILSKRQDLLMSHKIISCKSCACKRRNFGKLGTQPLELKDQQFGDWTVLEEAKNNKPRKYWKCLCKCGTISIIHGSDLKLGKSTKCKGCLIKYIAKKRTTHGCSSKTTRTAEYRTWSSMLSRCNNLNNKRYYDYGGRGIKVCKEWSNSFETFLKDVGIKPFKNSSLDRINNNGNYEPDNIRWATPKQQANNRRNNVNRTF